MKRRHQSTAHGMSVMRPAAIERIIYGETLPELAKAERKAKEGISSGAAEARAHMEAARKALEEQSFQQMSQINTEKGTEMTVSLYASAATGKREIVVQTNAQSLELFIVGLADALDSAIDQNSGPQRPEFLASLLRNAIPVAFAIAGYKAERVSETRMLSCGTAAPGESNLLAHSRT